jgi:molybdate transport system substrate-binding protein
MGDTIRIISSMATRQLLTELLAAFESRSNRAVSLESVGGVDAARRVRDGEAFDAVVLAGNAIETLMAAGHLRPRSRVDIARSGVAVAVREGAARPDIGSEAAVREAVLAARSLSYSTGPSGVHLSQLFQRWGLAETLAGRLVQAPPGVPVGSLVARGEVELGFQQFSELMDLEGITVLGPLPPEIQIVTTFAGAVAATAADATAVQSMLDFLAAPELAPIKQGRGMEPA